MLKCKHHCDCPCSLEIGTCIINDAGRQAAHKKQRKCMLFGRISPNDVLYLCFEIIYYLSTQKNPETFFVRIVWNISIL